MTTYEAEYSTEQATIKKLLEKIKGDILYIDGGCPACIDEFCEGVNNTLEGYGLKLEFDRDNPKKLEVTVIKPTL